MPLSRRIIEQRKFLKCYFTTLLDLVAEEHLDVNPFLQQCNLTVDDIHGETEKLSFDRYHELLCAIDETGLIPGIGIRAGSRRKMTDTGIYGLAILSSTSIAHAVELGTRYHSQCITNVIGFECRMQGKQAVYLHKPLRSVHLPLRPLLEDTVAHSIVATRSLLPPDISWSSCEVRFAFSEPEYSAMYTKYIPCQVLFEQEYTEIRHPAWWMDIKPVLADEKNFELYETQCKMLQDIVPSKGSVAGRVENILIQFSSTGFLRETEVADLLNISERTLRYQLALAGTSFRDIVNDVRVSVAKHYLRETRLPIKEIAYLVGFEYSCNFHRSFTKLTGMTPKNFRVTAG